MKTRKIFVFSLLIFSIFVLSCEEEETSPENNENNNQNSILTKAEIQNRLDQGETPKSIIDENPDALTNLWGRYYEGGYIFFFDEEEGYGLVAAKEDAPMYGYAPCIPGIPAVLGESPINTGYFYPPDIHKYTDYYVNNCSIPGTAAQICANYISNGYDDWFLPDSQSLQLIENLNYQDNDMVNIEGLYWAASYSTLDERNIIVNGNTGLNYNGSTIINNKNTLNVRPIRFFNTTHLPPNFDIEPSTIQQKLYNGKTPNQLLEEGHSLVELYGNYYKGGLISHFRPETNTFVLIDPIARLDVNELYGIIPELEWGCFDGGAGWVSGPITNYGEVNTNIVLDTPCYAETESNSTQTIFSLVKEFRTSVIEESSYNNYFIPSTTELISFKNHVLEAQNPYVLNAPYFPIWSSNINSAFSALKFEFPFDFYDRPRSTTAVFFPARLAE